MEYNDIRSIGRGVAKKKAKKAGISRPCSKPLLGSSGNISIGTKAPETPGRKGKSWFSENWRAIVEGMKKKEAK